MNNEIEEEAIKKDIKKWIEENRENFPLNIDYWSIHINDKQPPSSQEDKMLSFGRYNAKEINTNTFYKPQSRIIKINE